MKFNLKLFVLVGVLAGFRDVCGTEDVNNKAYDGFIVAGFEGNKELEAAMDKRRVIKAIYKTEKGGNVPIMHGKFQNKLSKAFVRAGNVEDGVKEVDHFAVNESGRICYDMEKDAEYTVYFIFKDELLNSTASMFKWCIGLIHADLSNFNTKKVENMSYMFYMCTALKDLDLSEFNTQNVTNMSYMFSNCSSLTKLDLSSFVPTNVTNMSYMFSNCSSLTKLDLSSFVPTNVTDMSRMFFKCSSLKDLNLINFNTKKVTDMSFMFSDCSSLTKLNLSKFNTKKVTNMFHMFYKCTALKNLNLGNFVFSNCCKIDDMFLWCDFDNLCIPNTRERRWCCGDRYVDLKGEVVAKLNKNNVEFEVVQDDPVSNDETNLV